MRVENNHIIKYKNFTSYKSELTKAEIHLI
jgi:hypothetical protein